jgi:hypothetical protein
MTERIINVAASFLKVPVCERMPARGVPLGHQRKAVVWGDTLFTLICASFHMKDVGLDWRGTRLARYACHVRQGIWGCYSA